MNKHTPQPEALLNQRRLVSALRSLRRGDFSVRLDEDDVGDESKIAVLFNEVVSLNEQLTGELKRLSTALRCLLMTGFADAETLASLPAHIEVIPKTIDSHRLAQALV